MAGRIKKHVWPSNDFRPFAQVTVVDAEIGDCNIVDFCHYPPANSSMYEKPPWRRTIIDTGPSNSRIHLAIKKLVAEQTLPVQFNLTPATLPEVHELQITHIDEDHIGNATDVAEHLHTVSQAKNYQHKIEAIFQRFPVSWPSDFTLDPSGLVPQDGATTQGGDETQRTTYRFTSQGLKEWERGVTKLGISLFMRLGPSSDSFNVGSWYEDDDTKHGQALIFEYTKADVDKNPPVAPKIAWEIEAMYNDKVVGRGQGVEDCPPVRWRNQGSTTVRKKIITKKTTKKVAAIAKKKKLSKTKQFLRMVQIQQIYRSVVHLDDLYEKISSYPQTFTQIDPVQGQRATIKHRLNQGHVAPGVQIFSSPDAHLLANVMRYGLLYRWEKERTNSSLRDPEATNRASIVTMFYRSDLKLKMLFTGDAHDKHCDIRNTILGWSGADAWQSPLYDVDVLKIPHHGSEATTLSQFYSVVQAKVYLICGRHNSKHGNPKFSSLKAIVETFRNRTAKGPFYLFFSNPDADEDGTFPSAASQLLAQDGLKPSQLNYQMWKLREIPNNNTMNPFGTILIGNDQNEVLKVEFDRVGNKSQWVQIV